MLSSRYQQVVVHDSNSSNVGRRAHVSRLLYLGTTPHTFARLPTVPTGSGDIILSYAYVTEPWKAHGSHHREAGSEPRAPARSGTARSIPPPGPVQRARSTAAVGGVGRDPKPLVTVRFPAWDIGVNDNVSMRSRCSLTRYSYIGTQPCIFNAYS